MKKLISALFCVIIIYLISVIYRDMVTPVLNRFPTEELGSEAESNARLNLVLFFSMANCPPCLQHIINYLNQPPEQVRVIGVVRVEELKNTGDIRRASGASFPIISLKQWKKYRPNYAPTLYGVGPDGKIYFVIACTGLEEIFIRSYVDEFMRKADYLLSLPLLK